MSERAHNAIRQTKIDTQQAPLVGFNIGNVIAVPTNFTEIPFRMYQPKTNPNGVQVYVDRLNVGTNQLSPEQLAGIEVWQDDGNPEGTFSQITIDTGSMEQTGITIYTAEEMTQGSYVYFIAANIVKSSEGIGNLQSQGSFTVLA